MRDDGHAALAVVLIVVLAVLATLAILIVLGVFDPLRAAHELGVLTLRPRA